MAVGAVECASLSDCGFDNGCAAAGAGFAAAAVHFVFLLEIAAVAGAVGEVAQGAAACLYGAAQDLFGGPDECFAFGLGEGVGGAKRGYGSLKQAFVGIDVADADNGGVVHQGGFDGAGLVFQAAVQKAA